MSLTSYRAAPPRVNPRSKPWLTGFKLPPNERAACAARYPVGGPIRKEKIKERALGRPGSDLLSRVLRRSTISAGAFHGRVRNGIGCSRSAITTRSAKRTLLEKLFSVPSISAQSKGCHQKWALGMRTIKPIELLVPVSFKRCRSSTPGLSTWSSSTVLREYSF